ncbi:acyltransferase [Cytobacillus oceanisediminis]|uniref:Transferase n=1 Tax=Cytobacillus oceanisediminis 2691 TaxID=1196031 RepID=A0A160MGW6_9BACI|nr:acyltransferase [Cytobacillus oceanisediminis]AND42264.1 hypothetical protein A361_24975 [Cytobacillus oceanisediminis 2691]
MLAVKKAALFIGTIKRNSGEVEMKYIRKILLSGTLFFNKWFFIFLNFRNSTRISRSVKMKNINNIELGEKSRIRDRVYLYSYRDGKIILGKNVTIEDYVILEALNKSIEIGDNSTVNQFSIFRSWGDIKIGNGVRIGPHVQIMAMNHIFTNSDKYIYQQGIEGSGIEIGNNVWIGGNVTILDGVKIGDNCVIGAGSIVVKNIEENSLAVGNPAKIIKKLNFYI